MPSTFDERRYANIHAVVAGVFAILLGITIHEWAHAVVARSQGDHTAEAMGRVSLNPIHHIDIFGTVLLPLLLLITSGGRWGVGWAKPVPVNPYNFRKIRKGMIIVSAAGPASNIIVATASGLALRAIGRYGEGFAGPFTLLITSICIVNLYLAFFNLIPVPPLDGSGIVAGLLPSSLGKRYQNPGIIGMLIILGLIFAGATRLLVAAPARKLFEVIVGFSY